MIGVAIVAAVVLSRCGGGGSSSDVTTAPDANHADASHAEAGSSETHADPAHADATATSVAAAGDHHVTTSGAHDKTSSAHDKTSGAVAAARAGSTEADGVWTWELGACPTIRAVFTTTAIVDCDAGAAASTLTVRLTDGRAVRTGDGSVVTLANGRVIGYRTLRATGSLPERRAYYEYGRDGRIARQLGALPVSLVRDEGATTDSTVWVPTVHDGLLVGLRVSSAGEARRSTVSYRENTEGLDASGAADGLRVFDLATGAVVASFSSTDPAIGGSPKSVWAVADGLVYLKGHRQPTRGFDPVAGRVTWTSDAAAGSTDPTTSLALLGRMNLGQAGVLDLRQGALDPATSVIDGRPVPISGARQHRPSDGRLAGELVLAGLHVVVDGGVVTAYRGGVEVWSAKGTVTDVATAPGGLLVIAGTEAQRSVWFAASR